MDEPSLVDEIELRRHYLFRPCESREELKWWLVTFLGLDFPDCIVDDDSNSTPLDMVWETYSKMWANKDEDFTRVLYYACRDSFKTLGVAAVEVLCILHLNRSVAHMAAISEQATKAQSYVKKAFRRPHLRDFVVGDNQRETKIVRFYNPKTKHSLTVDEYEALSDAHKGEHTEIARTLTQYREREEYIKIVICTMQGANSEHVPLLVIDEVDVVTNPAAYAEAQNIPSGRDDTLPLTILTSTRKTAFGLVQDEITRSEKAVEKGEEVTCHIRHWNINEITRPCPSTRHKCGTEHEDGHCPVEPSVVMYRNDDRLHSISEHNYSQLSPKEQGEHVQEKMFPGCTSCRLAPTCRTWLATRQKSKSSFLNSIPKVIAKFRAQASLDMAKAQLLCRKPSSSGLIYPRFEVKRHVISPQQAYLKLFGESYQFHDGRNPNTLTKEELLVFVREREVHWYGAMDFGMGHNYVYVHGFKDGDRFFVTNIFTASGLGIDEQVTQVEKYLQDSPMVYPDMADKQAIRIFRKAGFNMKEWKKGAGTISGGITAVSAQLNPVGSDEPRLFLIHDVDDEPMMDLLIKRIQEYHWKLDAAGKPTSVPEEENDDEMDALRYLVMNVFPMKGAFVGGGAIDTTPAVEASAATIIPSQSTGYDPNDWVRQMVQQHTGQAIPSRPRMTVEAPAGSGYTSYYEDENSKTMKASPGGKKKKADVADEGDGKGKAGSIVWNI